MKIVVQRVFEAWVKVQGATISHIKEGIIVFVGLTPRDNKNVVEHMAAKALNMRLWRKQNKKWQSSVIDIKGEVLAVSQFTLYGTMKGNRPDFHQAMPAEEARQLFHLFVGMLKTKYKAEKIQTGEFQTLMEVGLIINGPAQQKPQKKKEEKFSKMQQKIIENESLKAQPKNQGENQMQKLPQVKHNE